MEGCGEMNSGGDTESDEQRSSGGKRNSAAVKSGSTGVTPECGIP